MRLLVTDVMSADNSFDVVSMSAAEFNTPQAHLFILSNAYDEIVVTLSDKVNLGVLPKLMTRHKVVPKVEGDISPHTISLLCEVVPDKSAELRYTFMRNREGTKDVIDRIARDMGWIRSY